MQTEGPEAKVRPIADLRDAGDAIENLIDLRDYLPPGESLIRPAGYFRDHIRKQLDLPVLAPPERGSTVTPLSDMCEENFGRLRAGVALLLGRFARWMDAPELVTGLSALNETLRAEALRRADLAAASAEEGVTAP